MARLRRRNIQKKSSTLRFSAGSTRLLIIMSSTLLGLLLTIHLIARQQETDIRILMTANHFRYYAELQKTEEEIIRLPPVRKRSPRAVKRMGPKKTPSFVNEYLDQSSDLHTLFFPDQRTAIDPRKDANGSRFYYPGRVWLDMDGNHIQAHGGGILFDQKSETYYWYGENKNGPTYHAHKKGPARVDIIGVSCYSSKDLWSWRFEGIVLRGEESDVTHELYKLNVLERPKVIYNDKSGKYVMWMHIDDTNYTKASVGVAVSSSPTGPFTYLYSMRPHGFDSRDMTVFKDDDRTAYLFYSSDGNRDLHVSPLTEDYLNVTSLMRRIFVRQRREAPAVFKHQGTYYMITSGCSSWAPNKAMAHATDAIMGPWESLGNPCRGGSHLLRLVTFFSQSTFVLPVPSFPGLFIFMADRWNPSELSDSRYVWLPLLVGGLADEPLVHSFGFPLWPRVSIYWHRRWSLPDGSQNT